MPDRPQPLSPSQRARVHTIIENSGVDDAAELASRVAGELDGDPVALAVNRQTDMLTEELRQVRILVGTEMAGVREHMAKELSQYRTQTLGLVLIVVVLALGIMAAMVGIGISYGIGQNNITVTPAGSVSVPVPTAMGPAPVPPLPLDIPIFVPAPDTGEDDATSSSPDTSGWLDILSDQSPTID